jgi:dTDP-glucose 4,6-dehydratase
LNWNPSVTVEEGMRRTVAWYLENRWWWQAVRERGFDGVRMGLGAPQPGPHAAKGSGAA